MGKGKKSADASGSDKGSKHFTKADYAILCDWLEIGLNQDKLTRAQGKTKVGGRHLVKAKAFDELADYVNANQKKGSSLNLVDGKSMRMRWTYFWKRFRIARGLSRETGFGLTGRDEVEGLTSIAEKLEVECPLYARMADIFKGQPNVDPWAKFQVGLRMAKVGMGPSKIETPKDDEEEEGSGSPSDEVAYSPELNLAGEELELDPFIPDSVPININNAVPDSLVPPSHVLLGDGQERVEEDAKLLNILTGLREPQAPRSNGVHEQNAPRVQPAQNEGMEEAPTANVASGDAGQNATEPSRGRAMTGERRCPGRPQRAPSVTSQGRRPSNDENEGVNSALREEMPRGAQIVLGDATDVNGAAPVRENSRSRSQIASKEHLYPNKKQINDNRHAINSAFAANLESVNLLRERTNKLRAKKIEQDQYFEESRFEWQRDMHMSDREDKRELEQRKLEWDKEKFQLEQLQKVADVEAGQASQEAQFNAAQEERAAAHSLDLKVAFISSNMTMEELKIEKVREPEQQTQRMRHDKNVSEHGPPTGSLDLRSYPQPM